MFDLDFLPPPELQRPLWRSLVINLADRFAPERLAPLQLTSKPVDVVLPADTIELPWYRTVAASAAGPDIWSRRHRRKRGRRTPPRVGELAPASRTRAPGARAPRTA